MAEPVYAVRYAPSGARIGYVVAMLAAAASALTAIVTARWGLLAPAIAIVVIAERLRPYAGEHPQIRLDADGLTIYGLGFLPWRAVSDARAFEHVTGEGVRAWLMLEIKGGIEKRLARAPASFRLMQVKPWRVVGRRGLVLKLEGLEDTPDVIRRAFEQYSNRRIAVDRV